MITVFDRAQIARQRNRSLQAPANHTFLIDWTMDQIVERMNVVKRTFPIALQIGARGKPFEKTAAGVENLIICDSVSMRKKENLVLCEEDFLPFKESSLDLVVSALNLHTVNDLPGALLQIRKALKPDGLFVAGILGGETLHELRTCLQEAELELTGGISPRVAPFADKPQMGALLQRAGFSLPVVDSEIVTVTYGSIFNLMHDLRWMGEGNAIQNRKKTFTPRRLFLRAAELYAQKFAEPDGRIFASFEIIFLLGWAPHESQQKPLRPGAAQSRLADALGTVEIGAGENTH